MCVCACVRACVCVCVDDAMKDRLFAFKVATIVLAVFAGIAIVCIIILIRYFIFRGRTSRQHYTSTVAASLCLRSLSQSLCGFTRCDCYSDPRSGKRSIVMSIVLSVRVCLPASISPELHVQRSPFLCTLSVRPPVIIGPFAYRSPTAPHRPAAH